MSFTTIYTDTQYDDQVVRYMQNLVAEIDAQATEAGLYYPFKYVNYAGAGQETFSLLGNGASLEKLESIAAKYGMCHFRPASFLLPFSSFQLHDFETNR